MDSEAPALQTLPTEILHAILDALRLAAEADAETVASTEYADFSRRCALAVATASRGLRRAAAPWTFATLHNAGSSHGGSSVPPTSLWRFVRTFYVRDYSHAQARPIAVDNTLLVALENMPVLTTVTLYLRRAVPPDFFYALGALPALSALHIYQAQIDDGRLDPSLMRFEALHSLTLRIRVAGLTTVTRAPDVDTNTEAHNVSQLLLSVSPNVRRLTVSGDLLPRQVLKIQWPRLATLSVTEHPPLQHLPLSALLPRMPALSDLSLLFTPDAYHSLPAGVLDSLRSLALSNTALDDPLLHSLPRRLTSLKLLALWDVRDPDAPPLRIVAGPPAGLGAMREFCPPQERWAVLFAQLGTLPALGTLYVTIGEFAPMAGFVDAIAALAPALHTLEIRFPAPDSGVDRLMMVDLTQGETLFAALRALPLRHLCLFTDYYYAGMHPGPPAHSAYRLLAALPYLETITYKFGGWYSRESDTVEFVWGRGMLARHAQPPPRVIRYVDEHAFASSPPYVP
ncbi:hypothetical protein MIND_00933200 [Mycena indigotica]|uniref:Uncharacterized protein n=1 Tax=Mycena indigotica TaxID=2126181 RepID=A0A8H6W2J0_9AGAR|nr:uncharacterized protein MIND_00933200 [Mycena indigotica]KAF7297009.1 hypothetical protein MIND_00933200 [Mycena indigotica]